ncbi:OsmC family protein [Dawidia soli]|uniref:OsmC family protein n=1 Tax=Dawidia soli TaxID=2782352 RepID=A0AAP2GGJ8_9BACT|nr:OsmC family protein [Dawidia soli]MBT1690682.1 OsmC family protein [Dawidia soli]
MIPEKTAVATIGTDSYYTALESTVHTLHADEPVENGGTDRGPTPHDFLRMSLASCTAITLRMYANRKSFAVQQIQVKVRSEQVDNKTIFYRDVVITGNLDEAQRKRMLQIANACPVHKTLTNPIEIQTDLSATAPRE